VGCDFRTRHVAARFEPVLIDFDVHGILGPVPGQWLLLAAPLRVPVRDCWYTLHSCTDPPKRYMSQRITGALATVSPGTEVRPGQRSPFAWACAMPVPIHLS